MWTETHYYNFPDAAAVPNTPPEAAIDIIGATPSGYLLNVRWWGHPDPAWAPFQQPAPQFPKRVFA